MKQIPILMSSPMVKAIMNTKEQFPVGPIDPSLPFKCMTRRTRGLEELNICPDDWELKDYNVSPMPIFKNKKTGEVWMKQCPYGSIGDIYWVRETFLKNGDFMTKHTHKYWYKSAQEEIPFDTSKWKWKPSIHMPKDAARIWLRNTGNKIERLHDITSAESEYEGIKPLKFLGGKDEFRVLWISINGWDSWNHNPWVWAIGFQVISKTGKPDMEICEGCSETNILNDMRMDTEEANWYCATCWMEMEKQSQLGEEQP